MSETEMRTSKKKFLSGASLGERIKMCKHAELSASHVAEMNEAQHTSPYT